jgi:alkylated DNA nucleotide flippase Atl1
VTPRASRPARRDTPSGPGISAVGAEESSYVADVLDIVERIPPGKVLTYGDIAALVGSGGPRQVGQVMSRWGGGGVPWWRVLRADGSPVAGHESRALRHYAEEGTPLRPGGQKVDLRRARWDAETPG